MPGGEGSEIPGYDGKVVANKGTPFVPEGKSVWELGTGEDPATKARVTTEGAPPNPWMLFRLRRHLCL
jgi:hypothetical protein